MPATVRSAEEFGASVGARSFSKEYELEADQLGTILTMRAGYDPVLGAEFFMRIPDPGEKFLGSHPPNAAASPSSGAPRRPTPPTDPNSRPLTCIKGRSALRC